MLPKYSHHILGGLFIISLVLSVLAVAAYIEPIEMYPYQKYQALINYEQKSDGVSVESPETDKIITSIIFGGDVMLARHVQTLQAEAGGYESAWENIATELSQADLAIVNLESPFAEFPPYPTEGFIFRAKPENISGLQSAGIDVVNLANNHLGNADIAGMNYTFNLLEENKIFYLGAGRNYSRAHKPLIYDINDTKIGLLSQAYNVGYPATDNNPGVAVYNLDELKKTIKFLKDNGTDIIIVQFHGGIEYVREPNQQQIDFSHAAIEAGADLVIGHHPHWIQQIEKYQGKYIFYSLGNLIFDQNWSIPTSQGLVLKVDLLDKNITQYELLPIIIEDNFRPRWATEAEDLRILQTIGITSTIIKVE